jgi:hypothetical protein
LNASTEESDETFLKDLFSVSFYGEDLDNNSKGNELKEMAHRVE